MLLSPHMDCACALLQVYAQQLGDTPHQSFIAPRPPWCTASMMYIYAVARVIHWPEGAWPFGQQHTMEKHAAQVGWGLRHNAIESTVVFVTVVYGWPARWLCMGLRMGAGVRGQWQRKAYKSMQDV